MQASTWKCSSTTRWTTGELQKSKPVGSCKTHGNSDGQDNFLNLPLENLRSSPGWTEDGNKKEQHQKRNPVKRAMGYYARQETKNQLFHI